MKKLLNSRIFQGILVLTLILVWGYNVLQITDLSIQPEPVSQTRDIVIDQALFELPEQQKYSYSPDFRDPFQIDLPKKQTGPKPRAKPQKKEPVKLPPLTLTGVINGTALLQNSGNVTFFAEEGDTVEGAKIRVIYSDSVKLVFKSKEFVLTVN